MKMFNKVFKLTLVSIVFLGITIKTSYAENNIQKENSKKITKNNSEKLKEQIKANMHTFQTMIETFAIENKGMYPENISELIKEANKIPKNIEFSPYYKAIKNPFGENIISLVDMDSDIEGTIIYFPIRDSKCNISNYMIFANEEKNTRLKNKSGEYFYLSNY